MAQKTGAAGLPPRLVWLIPLSIIAWMAAGCGPKPEAEPTPAPGGATSGASSAPRAGLAPNAPPQVQVGPPGSASGSGR
jgi:hypothetical protein